MFDHPAITLKTDKPLVYTAMSRHIFYARMFISKFVLEQGGVPLNPFMIFDYFMLDTVDKNLVREGNNNLVKRADEIWVFGPVSDGALAEIMLAHDTNRPVRYFSVYKTDIAEISKDAVELEVEVADQRDLL